MPFVKHENIYVGNISIHKILGSWSCVLICCWTFFSWKIFSKLYFYWKCIRVLAALHQLVVSVFFRDFSGWYSVWALFQIFLGNLDTLFCEVVIQASHFFTCFLVIDLWMFFIYYFYKSFAWNTYYRYHSSLFCFHFTLLSLIFLYKSSKF